MLIDVLRITFLATIFFLSTNQHLLGQSIQISGKVVDHQSGENLIGAHVFTLQNQEGGTNTNRYGFFSLNVQNTDSVTLTVSYLGYRQLDTVISRENLNSFLIFKLKEQSTVLEEIRISDKKNNLSRSPGIVKLSKKKIEQTPSFFGENDLVKTLQFMPGVSSGSEGGSNIFVRGGTPDQNLFLLDNVPVYNINHLANFVSIFNSDAISHVELYKGSFPARYGGRLSSIVDVQMKEGNRKDFHFNGAIGPISGKIMIEGPINSKMSYMASARRFWFDLISWPISKLVFNGIGVGYNFGDYNIKLNYKVSDKDHIYLSLYHGRDHINFGFKNGRKETKVKSKFKQSWGNDLVGIRWNHLFGKNIFVNNTIYFSRYHFRVNEKFNSNPDNINNSSKVTTGIADYGFKSEWEWFLNSKFSVEAGMLIGVQRFNPGKYKHFKSAPSGISIDTVFRNQTLSNLQANTYMETRYKGKKVDFSIGLRYVYFSGLQEPGNDYQFLEPRLFLGLMVNEKTSLFLDYAEMNQFQQLLSKTGVGFPTDIWIPSVGKITPGRSRQASIGVQKSLYDGLLNISGSVFYKQMGNLVAFRPGASFFSQSGDWQSKVIANGEGTTKGLELLAEKESGRLKGWVSYTWMKTDRQFDALNNGNRFPFRYDRRHQVNFTGTFKLSESINLSAAWSYHSGDAITLASAKYAAVASDDKQESGPYPFYTFNEDAYYYGAVNGARMRSFHRLDLGANFRKEKHKGFRVWEVSVVNVYNRKNPYFYYYGTISEIVSQNGTSRQMESEPQLLQITIFPLMPSISYKRIF